MTPATRVDRAALVRRALVELVAESGFRGTSMAAVAKRAGVATGTAYVHYESKDDLILAAYLEVKASLAAAMAAASAPSVEPAELFIANWHRMYAHLAADPVQARFLLQVEASPFAAQAHEAAMAAAYFVDQPGMQELLDRFVDLPPLVLWDISMGPAVRAAASGARLSDRELDELAQSCWRAVSRPTA